MFPRVIWAKEARIIWRQHTHTCTRIMVHSCYGKTFECNPTWWQSKKAPGHLQTQINCFFLRLPAPRETRARLNVRSRPSDFAGPGSDLEDDDDDLLDDDEDPELGSDLSLNDLWSFYASKLLVKVRRRRTATDISFSNSKAQTEIK